MKFRVFDFILDSDVSFPELQRGSGCAALTLCRDARRASPRRRATAMRGFPIEARRPWLSIGRLPDGTILFDFDRTLSVRYARGSLFWRRRPACGAASFRHLVLDQALPFVAAHEGRTVLHAACVALAGRAILIAGPARAGKSTLAASLAGVRSEIRHPTDSSDTRVARVAWMPDFRPDPSWTVGGDDAAVVGIGRTGVLVTPEYSGLRLWPDSAGALGFARGARVADRSRKRRFTPPAPNDRGLPLDGIVMVAPAAPDDRVTIHDLTRRDAVIALVGNAFVLDPSDRRRSAALLDALTTLAARVPVFELRVPHRFDALDRARALIERHLSAAGAA